MMWRRIAIGAGAVMALLLLVIAGGYMWLDTQSGRNFLARQIASVEMENGLNIRIGKIEGSIYSDTVLRDVQFRDPKGGFARAPEIRLDWSPLSYFSSGVNITSLRAPTLNVARMPEFRIVPDRGDPLLPDLDINIGRLQIDRIVFAKGISRAIVTATAGSLRGDRIVLKLDAVPDDNRFDVDLNLDAPAKGVVAGLLGRDVPMQMTLVGRGSWRKWDGALSAQMGAEDVADIALTAREGTFTAKGTAAPTKFMANSLLVRALSPVANIDMAASFAERSAKISGTLRSAAMEMRADGIADLGEARFRDLALDIRLLRPGIIGSNVSGTNVRGTAYLNGAFAEPTVAYSATA
ncbi:MAG: hypothetical protein RLZZ604_1413, partial [Pseudomonadota bacterium]